MEHRMHFVPTVVEQSARGGDLRRADRYFQRCSRRLGGDRCQAGALRLPYSCVLYRAGLSAWPVTVVLHHARAAGLRALKVEKAMPFSTLGLHIACRRIFKRQVMVP